jgi:hypothetical protein
LVGGGFRIIDIREADGHERPSASPQLLGKLPAAFPDARVLVVELTDLEHDVRLGGPVTRALDAGADTYLVARSLEQLAELRETLILTRLAPPLGPSCPSPASSD